MPRRAPPLRRRPDRPVALGVRPIFDSRQPSLSSLPSQLRLLLSPPCQRGTPPARAGAGGFAFAPASLEGSQEPIPRFLFSQRAGARARGPDRGRRMQAAGLARRCVGRQVLERTSLEGATLEGTTLEVMALEGTALEGRAPGQPSPAREPSAGAVCGPSLRSAKIARLRVASQRPTCARKLLPVPAPPNHARVAIHPSKAT